MRTLEAEGDDGEKADAGATPEFPAAKQ